MHQPIILSKGHTKSAFPQLHEIPQREQGETLSPFRWLNRYTPYTVHQCKHPKLDKALYRVITHHNEKKYVNYEAVITLANHYREKLGLALFEEYVDHTQPPLHRLSGKTV